MIRDEKLQNVYAIRLINMILMGIQMSKSSYIDRFAYSLYCGPNSIWDEDTTWTEHLFYELEEHIKKIKKGENWKSGVLLILLAKEDVLFWKSLGLPFKSCKSIEII